MIIQPQFYVFNCRFVLSTEKAGKSAHNNTHTREIHHRAQNYTQTHKKHENAHALYAALCMAAKLVLAPPQNHICIVNQKYLSFCRFIQYKIMRGSHTSVRIFALFLHSMFFHNF